MNYLVTTDGQDAIWVKRIWPETAVRDLALLKAWCKAYTAGVLSCQLSHFLIPMELWPCNSMLVPQKQLSDPPLRGMIFICAKFATQEIGWFQGAGHVLSLKICLANNGKQWWAQHCCYSVVSVGQANGTIGLMCLLLSGSSQFVLTLHHFEKNRVSTTCYRNYLWHRRSQSFMFLVRST